MTALSGTAHTVMFCVNVNARKTNARARSPTMCCIPLVFMIILPTDLINMLLRFLLKSYDFALLHIIAEESRYLYCCILPSHSKGVRVLWLAQVNNENLFFTPLSIDDCDSFPNYSSYRKLCIIIYYCTCIVIVFLIFK